MHLTTATWQEVEAYLESKRVIVIPIGSHEQHGPNGFVGTDAVCPETIARGVGEKLDVMVGPTQAIGMAQHHLGFPGSITLRPSTLIAVIRDTILSLARHGFTHIYFLNGHGGNIATVNAAFSEVYADRSLLGADHPPSGLALRLYSWFQGRRVGELSRELYGDREGGHATPSEVSLTYFAYPDHVKTARMDPPVAPVGDIRDADHFRRTFPDGRCGSDPSLSTVEHGERLYMAGMADAVEDLKKFMAG